VKINIIIFFDIMKSQNRKGKPEEEGNEIGPSERADVEGKLNRQGKAEINY
jgi:hypothetical protein